MEMLFLYRNGAFTINNLGIFCMGRRSILLHILNLCLFSLLCYALSYIQICSIVHMEALRRMICTSARKLLLVRTRMKCQFLCRSAGAQVTLKSPGLSLLCKI